MSAQCCGSRPSCRTTPASPTRRTGGRPEAREVARGGAPPVGVDTVADSGADRDPLEGLVEEFLVRHRRGECPSISEYLARHPEGGAELRDLLSALLLVE